MSDDVRHTRGQLIQFPVKYRQLDNNNNKKELLTLVWCVRMKRKVILVNNNIEFLC